MIKSCRLLLVLLLLMLSTPGHAKQRIILDTDPSFDPDDVGCIAMLHAMASTGECEIVAMMNSMNHKQSSLTISAINTFYNRPAIPIGEYRSYGEYIESPEDSYPHFVASNYPRSISQHTEASDSVALYREILASAEPRSITVIVIGTMHNFYALLQSSPDDFSSQNGIDLVRDKVKLVATMGGNFIDGKGYDRTNWGGADALCEYTSWSCLNEERNRMCRYVIDNCPAPFVASGWEVGCGDYHDAKQGNVKTGQALKTLPANHIARRCYEFHFSSRGGEEKIDRHSNDQCALHYAVRGEGANYQAFLDGTIDLSPSGVCTWTSEPNRGQGYIQKKRAPQLIADEIEALMCGPTPAKDLTQPNPPEQLRSEVSKRQLVLRWASAQDPTENSWVVAYRVYKDGQLKGTTYGTRFATDLTPGTRVAHTYEVRSVNASGTESEPVRISVSLED